ncbi:MAG: hypothetical protein H7249_00250 [Chitinophagaceae bacterium]|nr:hypothetical protein [Oligoflexus sp.]
MRTVTSQEHEFQRDLWEIVSSIRNRLPIKSNGSTQSLTDARLELETLRTCAEALSLEEMVNLSNAMTTVVRSGLKGEKNAKELTEKLLDYLDESLLILCSL